MMEDMARVADTGDMIGIWTRLSALQTIAPGMDAHLPGRVSWRSLCRRSRGNCQESDFYLLAVGNRLQQLEAQWDEVTTLWSPKSGALWGPASDDDDDDDCDKTLEL